jgi:hypothetical protein
MAVKSEGVVARERMKGLLVGVVDAIIDLIEFLVLATCKDWWCKEFCGYWVFMMVIGDMRGSRCSYILPLSVACSYPRGVPKDVAQHSPPFIRSALYARAG